MNDTWTDELRVLRAIDELGNDATEPAIWVHVNRSLLEGGPLATASVNWLIDWLRATNCIGNRITTTIQGNSEHTISKYFMCQKGWEFLRTGIEPLEEEDDFATDVGHN